MYGSSVKSILKISYLHDSGETSHRKLFDNYTEKINNYYNEAIEMTRAAAEELAANWEGDAKEAFVADQMEALRWYGGLRDVAAAVVDAIRQNSRRYSDTASRLADIMRG